MHLNGDFSDFILFDLDFFGKFSPKKENHVFKFHCTPALQGRCNSPYSILASFEDSVMLLLSIICSQELNLMGGVTYDESTMGNAYGFCHVLDM